MFRAHHDSVYDDGLRLEKQRLSTAETRVFLLSGIIRCGECGKALVGQSAHGKNQVHRYYGHSKIDKGNSKPCAIKNLRAGAVETALLNYLDEIIVKSGHLNRIEKNMKSHLMTTSEDLRLEKEIKEKALHDLENEIDSVLKIQFSMESKTQVTNLLAEKLETMAEQRKLLKLSLLNIKNRLDSSNDARASRLNLEENLEKFRNGWKKSNPTVQKRFLRRIIDCLVYTSEGIKTFYHLDVSSNSESQKNQKKSAEYLTPPSGSFTGVNQSLRRLVVSSNQLIKSSSAFKDGAADLRSFELLALKAVHHYNIHMYKPVQDGIEKVVKSVVYTEDHPPAHLRELVHCYWELKTEAKLPEDFHYHVIPDACVNILLNQIDTKITAITALNVDSKKLNLGKLFHYVGIQLLPGVWQGSPGEIIKGFVDKTYEGKLPLVKFNKELTHLDFSAKQNVFTKLVEKLVQEEIIAPNVIISEILKNINEIQTVNDMATFAKMSTRQLQRTLKKTTGFSPHDFLKILRLQQSFREDYLSYYADQSHFIHSFRRITGYTPQKYIKKYNV